MPATYPVKLDKPSRHPKSFIITQITIIVIKVLLNPTTPYLIACLIVSILIYNLGNLLRCQFLDIRDRENIREEIAVLVTFIDHPIQRGFYIRTHRDQEHQLHILLTDRQTLDLAVRFRQIISELPLDCLPLIFLERFLAFRRHQDIETQLLPFSSQAGRDIKFVSRRRNRTLRRYETPSKPCRPNLSLPGPDAGCIPPTSGTHDGFRGSQLR